MAVSGAAPVITRLRTKDLGKMKAPEFIQAKEAPARRPGSGRRRSCGAADCRPLKLWQPGCKGEKLSRSQAPAWERNFGPSSAWAPCPNASAYEE